MSKLEQSCIDFAANPKACGITWEFSKLGYAYGGKSLPDFFESKVGGNRIYITCGHIRHKGEWIFACAALGFDNYILGPDFTAKEAAIAAISTCRTRANELASEFNTVF